MKPKINPPADAIPSAEMVGSPQAEPLQSGTEQAGAALRQKAEAALRRKAPQLSSQLEAHSLEEMRQTLQELQIYQIELEMQNEELRRSQVALDAERARYFDFYNLAPVGYISVSEGGLIVEANLTLATLLGIDRGALLKQRITRFILNEDVSAYYLLHKKLIENAGPQRCELRMQKSDGTQFWAHLAATAEQADDGVVLRVVLSDITERKQVEAEVRRLAVFPMLNPNPVLEFSADGLLIYSNRAAQSMAEAVGSADVLNLLPSDTQQIVNRCLARRQPHLLLETKHGARTLSWSFYPITSLSVVHCYVGDITDRVRQEEQLRQSQKMETIGQLAAGVAHDFNNLLTIVQFETTVLTENHSLDAESRADVNQIAKAAERAANLTRQLLAFSHKQEKETRLIDLPALVADITSLIRRIIGEDIVLSTHATPGMPLILADPGMIEQVVMNLAVNSRDAMPDGGQIDFTVGEIAFDSAAIPQHPGGRPGRYLKLEVRDTGTGIAPEHLSRIFEPFFTTKEAGKGTGLGLATVFSIARQHDGWVEVASELGRGTVFHVFLPVTETPTETVSPPAALLPATLTGGSETILIAEDEEPIRALIQVTLERYGYRVLSAENGTKALEILSENGAKVDLLITDMVMPGGVGGRKLTQKLQVLHADLKIIFTSGFTSETVSKELNLEPGINFLRKPFSIYGLVELVRHRLDSVGVT
jgi:PAS domain S-box-containing protein